MKVKFRNTAKLVRFLQFFETIKVHICLRVLKSYLAAAYSLACSTISILY